jgi:hypothetical protein
VPNGNARPQERPPHDQVTVAELIARHGGTPRTGSRRARSAQQAPQPAYRPTPPEHETERTVEFAPVRPSGPAQDTVRRDRPDLEQTERIAVRRLPGWAEARAARPEYSTPAERARTIGDAVRARAMADAQRTRLAAAADRTRMAADAERTQRVDAERTDEVWDDFRGTGTALTSAPAPDADSFDEHDELDEHPESAGQEGEPDADELYVGELLRREGRRDGEVRSGVQLRRILAAAAGVSALCGAVAFGATHVVDQSQQSASSSPDQPLRVVPGNRITDPSDLDPALAPQRDAATVNQVTPADTTTTASASSVPSANVPAAPASSAPTHATTSRPASSGTTTAASSAPARSSASAPSSGSSSGSSSSTSPPSSTASSPPASSRGPSSGGSGSGGSGGGVLSPVTGLLGGLLGAPTNP